MCTRIPRISKQIGLQPAGSAAAVLMIMAVMNYSTISNQVRPHSTRCMTADAVNAYGCANVIPDNIIIITAAATLSMQYVSSTWGPGRLLTFSRDL